MRGELEKSRPVVSRELLCAGLRLLARLGRDWVSRAASTVSVDGDRC